VLSDASNEQVPPVNDSRPSAFLARLVAALMLLVIGAHAAPLSSLPVRAGHGSAFSASTVEVALAPRLETVAEKRAAPAPQPLAMQPPGWRPDRTDAPGLAQAASLAARRAPDLPPRKKRGSQASPRAPPLS
jgi:hypothetical protein